MSAIPTTPLAPEDPEYQAIYDLWVKQGSASYVEKQSEGWLRQAIFPTAGVQPTFVLVCSSSGTTTANKTSGVTGYGRAMATKQKSHQPRGKLPKDAV